MNTYNLILHVLHITCGVFWGGVALLLHFFFIPAVKKAGPDGGKMMQALLSTRNFPIILLASGFLTVIVGLIMMSDLSNGYESWWFKTHMGMILSMGGFCGIVALMIALFWNYPAAGKISKISKSIAEAGTAPSNDQLTMMGALRGRIISGLKFIAWLLLITIICMASSHFA